MVLLFFLSVVDLGHHFQGMDDDMYRMPLCLESRCQNTDQEQVLLLESNLECNRRFWTQD